MGRSAIPCPLSYLQLIFMNSSVGAWNPGRCYLRAIVLVKNFNSKIPSEISDIPLHDLTCLLCACFSHSKTADTFLAQMVLCCNRIANTTKEKKNHQSPRHFRGPALNYWRKIKSRGDSGGGAFPGGDQMPEKSNESSS